MRDLEDTFVKYGDTFKLVCRHENIACIYSRTQQGKDKPSHYEVWKLRIHTSDNDLIKVKKGDIKAPGANDWGDWGWTYFSLDEAKAHYNRLINRKKYDSKK